MTNKKSNGNSKNNGKGKDEMRGFFASLRMTTKNKDNDKTGDNKR
jgi:hypothetical protein